VARGRSPRAERASLAAGVRVEVAATIAGSRQLERRLKRWQKTAHARELP
jgi:hypothetical protein